MLQVFVSALPKSVTSLSLNFDIPPDSCSAIATYITDELKQVCKSIPPHVTNLDLSRTHTRADTEYSSVPLPLSQIISTIPKTVITLQIGYVDFRFNYKDRTSLFSKISRGLRHLTFAKSELLPDDRSKLSHLCLNELPHITSLDLNSNQLGKHDTEQLTELFLQLPLTLTQLSLPRNNLSNIAADQIAYLFSLLRPTINHLDIGDNGLLLIGEDNLLTALSGIPATVNSLRLCESNLMNLSSVELWELFNCIPRHIELLSFSACHLMGLSVKDFTESLFGLPSHIKTLDLSQNHLFQKSPEDLCYLFSHLPFTIKMLNLSHDGLTHFDPKTLKRILSKLPKTLTCIDLSENGIETLPPSLSTKFLGALPDATIQIDGNALRVRNDGALVPRVSRQLSNSRQSHFHHQKEFARRRVVLMQLNELGHLPIEVMSRIMDFTFQPTSLKQLKHWEAELQNKRLISSQLPALVTPACQQEAYETASIRIEYANKSGADCVDLSRCGLKRINQEPSIATLFKAISTNTTKLNLRCNGLGQTQDTVAFTVEILSMIPPYITSVDLSGNGFEYYTAKQLTLLFAKLPATVQLVSLGQEKPLSPANQIALRQWPESYRELTSGNMDSLHQARALLDDYTKGDSFFWRFMYFHWNRHHADEIAKIIKLIDIGIIKNTSELMEELDLIDKDNDVGSLAKRISFFKHHSVNPPVELLQTNDPAHGALELKTIG